MTQSVLENTYRVCEEITTFAHSERTHYVCTKLSNRDSEPFKRVRSFTTSHDWNFPLATLSPLLPQPGCQLSDDDRRLNFEKRITPALSKIFGYKPTNLSYFLNLSSSLKANFLTYLVYIAVFGTKVSSYSRPGKYYNVS